MSAFRVFGTSWQQIFDDLYRKELKGNNESIADYDKRIAALANKVYLTSNRNKAVSEMCDAPNFCRDFIAMADPAKYKGLHIRVNAWNGKFKPGTKEPKYSWVDYDPSKEYPVPTP